MPMKLCPYVESIGRNILAHAEEYDGRLGESLRALAMQIHSTGDVSPVVNKLFGPEGGLYKENPSREEDLSLLFAEMRLPRDY